MTAQGGVSTLRRLTARGAVVNLLFGAFGQLLTGVQAIVVPRLLGPGDIGLYTIAMGGVGIGVTLKNFDIPRKLVQDRESDVYTSYGVAFTLELILAGSFFLLVLGIAPLLAYFYHRPRLWLLASLLATTVFSTAFLDLPAALPAREMRFVRWNLLLLVAPVVSFAVTVPAAALGAGVWSLAAGALAGFAASAGVLAYQSPIGPRLSWDRALVRRYLSFGWPLWLGGVLTIAATWGTIITVSAVLGVASLGFFQLAQNWAGLALQVDSVLSDTVFPALCTMQSSLSRLRRAFVITNRLSMLWASTVAFAVLLFAQPAVNLLLGPRWHPVLILLQAESAGLLLTGLAYNWQLFFAARGQTRPQLTVSILSVAWLVLVVIPLLVVWGLKGAAASIIVLGGASYAMRTFYVRRLLGPISLVRTVWREIAVGAVAAGLVSLLRLAGWAPRSLPSAAGQGAAYLVAAAAAAALLSRRPLGDALDALRRPASQEAVPATLRTTHPTPRRSAFPLLISHDRRARVVWVTLRDWSALGRHDLGTGEWAWTPLPPFPHSPTPDGSGGCWVALTRSSALAHVSAEGEVRMVRLEPTRELLVTTLARGALWAVDSDRLALWRIDLSSLRPTRVDLPRGLIRPDYVLSARGGSLWVGDTQGDRLVRFPARGGEPSIIAGPHPTRALLADPKRGGLWLGASDRPCMSLIDLRGRLLSSVTLPAVPFGMSLTNDGDLVVALRDADALGVVDPDSGHTRLISLVEGGSPMDCVVVGDHAWVTLPGPSEVEVVPLEKEE